MSEKITQHFLFSAIFLCALNFVECKTIGPIVSIDDGNIHGITLQTRGGRTISGFLGIPYAQPPVGNLRFANPKPLTKGSLKNYYATQEASECIQPDYWDHKIIRGSEDCLYLYVYTPIIDFKKIDTLYPVLVYLHGGDYRFMNGSFYSSGPQYLLDKNILLVTLNSRLDVLGYLSTNDEECPGNFGLKDQHLALQWVHNNIKAFGGDPSRVTLFGTNSGAVTAQIHSFVKGTEGLFDKLILDNAVANSVTSFWKNPAYSDRSRILAKALNCTTSNSKALVNCLREVDAKDLVKQISLFGIYETMGGSWTPCNEPNVTGAYFTMTLEEAISKNMRDIPVMYGLSQQAGIYLTKFAYKSETAYKSYRSNEVDVGMMKVFYPDLPKELLPKILEDTVKYYNDGPVPTNVNESKFLKLKTAIFTDLFYAYRILKMAQKHVKSVKSKAYLYRFNYRGVLSSTSKDIDDNQNVGANDGDVTIYLFPIPGECFRQNGMSRSKEDMKYVDIIVDYFTSFVINGHPSNRYYPTDMWQPFQNSSSSMIIGQTECQPAFEMGKSVSFMELWTAIYAGDLGTVQKLLYGEY